MKFNPNSYQPSNPEYVRLFQDMMNRRRLSAYRAKLNGNDIDDGRSSSDYLYIAGLLIVQIVIVILAILGLA